MQNRTLYFGDNLEILRDKFPGNEGYFDLIYLDPPFNSNRNYNVIFKEGLVDSSAQTHAFEDSWHWTSDTQRAFDYLVTKTNEDISNLMQSLRKIIGNNDMMAYLTMMAVRLIELYRVLKTTGTLYLHCDPTASHYLKIIMDVIFSKKNFRNEIVWCYRGAGYPKMDFGKRHDVIFRYSKTGKYTFNLDDVREEYAEATKKRFKHYVGNVRKAGDFGPQQLNPLGKQPDDWWQIQPIAPSSKERLGYPTQKPEALLERIIKASTKEDDWILDPFCGCGTTVAVSEKLKRNWIGIDISALAISVIKKRLSEQFRGKSLLQKINIDGLPKDLNGARLLFQKSPWDFEYWALLLIKGAIPAKNKTKENMKGPDKGIDGVITFLKDAKKNEYGKIIIQVKGGHVQRKDIATLKGDIEREKAEGGLFITLEKPTKPMKEEAVSSGTCKTDYYAEFLKVQIITIEELLNGKQPNLPHGLVKEHFKEAQQHIEDNEENLNLF